MSRTLLATLIAKACIGLFVVCSIAQLLIAVHFVLPIGLYVTIFFIVFLISAVIGLLQIRVEMIEREWPFFTYESIRTLFRRFPIWAGVAAVFMAVWHTFVIGSPQANGQSYPLLAGILAVEFGAVQSLRRQPWLLENLTCQDGHPITHYNRFCPTCGASLPKIPGSA